MIRHRTLLLAVMAAVGLSCHPIQASTETFYIDPQSGDDSADGSEKQPFRTIKRAAELVDGYGGTIRLLPGKVYRETIAIRKGGVEGNPLVIDGQGAVLNLGTDVTAGPWTAVGDEYRLERPIPSFTRHYVTSPLFVDGIPVWAEHPGGRGNPSPHGGSIRYEDERMIVRFPQGTSPAESVVVLTSSDMAGGIQSSTGRHVRIENLTIAFAGNDGVNIHNDAEDFILSKVRAVFNGDQGFSSHGRCTVEIRDSEAGFNGSQSAGIFDVNLANTTYVRVVSHQNRNGGVGFQGEGRHVLEHVVAYGNPGGNLPNEAANITLTECQAGAEVFPEGYPDWGSLEEFNDIKARFRALRPPPESP